MKARNHDVDEYPFEAILKVSVLLAFGLIALAPILSHNLTKIFSIFKQTRQGGPT